MRGNSFAMPKKSLKNSPDSFPCAREHETICCDTLENGLKINVSKTNLPGRKSQQTNAMCIHKNGREICQQDEVKYLGVTVDRNLSWKSHVQNLRRKCFAGLVFLHKHLPIRTRKLSTRVSLAHSWTIVKFCTTHPARFLVTR